MAQHERGALVAAETLHGQDDLLAQFGAHHQAILIRFCSRCAAHFCALRIASVVAIESSACSKKIERAVDGDAMKPGPEIRTLFEAVELSVRSEQRLLHHVIG